ncbi:nucleotidyl transferase AbiEii/AbiGii toxin family protein, partial [Faecalibacillus intestinalis]|uniref:nucleotidyl transferase AbiEii/AbiGii toxin family protein n=1 Tax=Faecalibacillus intestinalis TaxID=1982626 RepID=UPI003AB46DBA
LEANGRMKDFYDIYLIYKFTFERLNKDHFRNAVKKTFSYRAFNDDLYECFVIIEHSSILQRKWNAYVRKNKYARSITFSDTIHCLKKYIDILVPTYI